jgi:hypothetical protein
MNAILAITLIITLIITSILAAGLTALAMVIAGIHSEERHMNLSADPRTPAETLARHILGARVSQPGARRIFAARHASIAGQAAAHDTARPGPGGLPSVRRPRTRVRQPCTRRPPARMRVQRTRRRRAVARDPGRRSRTIECRSRGPLRGYCHVRLREQLPPLVSCTGQRPGRQRGADQTLHRCGFPIPAAPADGQCSTGQPHPPATPSHASHWHHAGHAQAQRPVTPPPAGGRPAVRGRPPAAQASPVRPGDSRTADQPDQIPGGSRPLLWLTSSRRPPTPARQR